MKRKTLSLILLLLLLVVPTATNVIYAQDSKPIVVVPPSEPEKDKDGDGIPDSDDKCPSKPGPRSNRGCPEGGGNSDDDNSSDDPSGGENPDGDRDGDGLSDKDDQCPDAGGPTWNGGCPEDEPDREDVPPSSPDPNDPPPFQPPALPEDACYVTPSINNNVNVRKATNLGADIIGFLSAGVVYEAQGVATIGAETWYALVTYEGSTGTVGYASGTVVLATTDCPPVNPSHDGDTSSDSQTNEMVVVETEDGQVVEYCIYLEVHEAGVFTEVCYEIEIPEGCVLTTSEAGVYTVDCGEGETVSLNPLFDGQLPGDVLSPDRDEEPVIFDGDDGGQVVEYCVYLEVYEVGVFTEVCYEIEIPEGCVLTTSEAGVYTVDCEDTVSLNPTLDGQLPDDVLSPDQDDEPVVFNGDDGGQVVEYCIYQEVHESGVFTEVCYEIEIPEGCVLTTSEAGVFTVDCDEDTVSLNPLFDDLPTPELRLPDTDNGIPLSIQLRFIYRTGSDCNNNGIDDLDEFFPPDCIGDLTTSTASN